MKFSVLICTYNRAEMLARCLDALVCRTEEKPDQVIVVNGGNARADEQVNKYAGRQDIQVKLVKTVNKNLAASRNVGLPYCTGDLVAMTDDDAEVYADWVTQMKRAHAEHPEAGAVGGAVLSAGMDSLVSRVADKVTFSNYPAPQAVRTLPGVNVSYKRAAVDQVGPQDEALIRGEDVDYNWRALQLGWKILYDPRIQVLHHHRPTLRSFLNQHYMYGRAYYRVRRKWPAMYCVYPHNFRHPKDYLKALNFIAAAFYEPVRYATRMERGIDKLLAYPILFANQIAWRGGMVREKLLS